MREYNPRNYLSCLFGILTLFLCINAAQAYTVADCKVELDKNNFYQISLYYTKDKDGKYIGYSNFGKATIVLSLIAMNI
ncbi:MAG: hypothetical protein K0R49_1094 [Burkholderiales bacterium]|jgi:hypothetical protein|nr:hypothetical protein [Burkholderiales bacterium]